MNTSNQLKSKQFLVPILILILFSFSKEVFSQPPVLELNIEVAKASAENTNDGEFKVLCDNGVSDYLFLLYDRQPIGNVEAIAQSSRITKPEYTFSDLKPGVYFICVYDGNNNSTCNKVEIGIK